MDVVNDAIMAQLADSTMPEAERLRTRKLVVQQVRDYLLPVARSAGDTSLRINGWLGAAYTLEAARDTTLLYAMIDEAERALPGNEFIIKLSPAMGRGKIMRAGATFPTFRMAAIGGGAELTNAVFAQSRYTLVDFWGTWCAPCVWEMPVLHKAYERFSAKGFNIVSLSNDPSLGAVQKVNGWMGPQDRSEPALTALGVMMFPLAVLVDSTGPIVTVSDGLRGDALERTLEKLLP
jgi:thiol-disulfide isomerase/thioredoxin